MTEIHDGELIFEDILDAVVVRFERVVPYPPAQVWEQLLARERLAEWLTSEPGGHVRGRDGGEVLLPTIGGALIESEVFECIPEVSLTFGWKTIDWDGGAVSWALERVEEGTRLTFHHSDDDLGPEHFVRTLTNWHMTFDLLEASLAGKPRSWNWDAWEQLYTHYERKLTKLIQEG